MYLVNMLWFVMPFLLRTGCSLLWILAFRLFRRLGKKINILIVVNTWVVLKCVPLVLSTKPSNCTLTYRRIFALVKATLHIQVTKSLQQNMKSPNSTPSPCFVNLPHRCNTGVIIGQTAGKLFDELHNIIVTLRFITKYTNTFTKHYKIVQKMHPMSLFSLDIW